MGVVPTVMDLDTQVALWKSGGLAGGGGLVIGPEPTNPQSGTQWLDHASWAVYTWYTDTDTPLWVKLYDIVDTQPPPPTPPPGPGPGPGPGTVPWASDLTYTVPFNTVTFMPGDGTGKIPIANWTGWDPAYAADFTDELLYLGPNRPTSPANLNIRMFALFIPPGSEVEVEFDGLTLGTPASNKVTIWGYDSGANTIDITGSNSTGNPIQLRLTKA